jgi:hypothetical protein
MSVESLLEMSPSLLSKLENEDELESGRLEELLWLCMEFPQKSVFVPIELLSAEVLLELSAPPKKLKNPPPPLLVEELSVEPVVLVVEACWAISFSFILVGIGILLSFALQSTTSFFFLNKLNAINQIRKPIF